MLGRVLAELGYDWKVEEAVPIIERIKMNFGRADEGSAEASFMPPTRTRWNAMGKIDFQDMLRLAVEQMQRGDITPYRFSTCSSTSFRIRTPCSFVGSSYTRALAHMSRWLVTTTRASTDSGRLWVLGNGEIREHV
jgi:hypothetical protein